MSDKFRRTYPLRITFGDGEQPTGAKLSAISEQTRNGLSLLEKAIGDPWNQSGDSILIDFPVWIPNLARQMGQNQFHNLALPPPDEDFYFTESIGLKFIGKTSGHLLYKPKDPLDFLSASGGLALLDRQTDENDVDRPGRWWVDPDTGRFRVYSALTGTEKVTYMVSPDDDWLINDETVPGVIPDPGQAEFTACRISTDGSSYFIHLPPRRPLTLSDRETPHAYPSLSTPDEVPDNEADVVPGGGGGQPGNDGYMMWQNGTTAIAGVDAAHYRYQLPKEIKDAIIASDLTAGDEIPQGILGLWDDTEKVWIEDIIFKIPVSISERYVLEVSSETFDFSTVVTASEAEANYSSTNLILVTCGSPSARMIWTLMNQMLKHQHHGSGAMDAPTSHSHLDDANPPDNNYAYHPDNYPTHLPAWAPSNWAHDPHTSLLSRAGSSSTAPRDQNNNAMLGHLILANSGESGTPPTFLDGTCADESFGLYFGDLDGPNLYGVSADTIRVNENFSWDEPITAPTNFNVWKDYFVF